MAASTQKVSVSLETKELRWVKALARQTRSSVSSLVNDALKRSREEREREIAQQALLAQFAPEERASAGDMEAIRAEWRA